MVGAGNGKRAIQNSGGGRGGPGYSELGGPFDLDSFTLLYCVNENPMGILVVVQELAHERQVAWMVLHE